MFTSGWILPDGTEIEAGAGKTYLHREVVERFIRGLRFQNLELSIKLRNLYEKMSGQNYGSKNIDDFAIRVLGWINVGTSKEKKLYMPDIDFKKNL